MTEHIIAIQSGHPPRSNSRIFLSSDDFKALTTYLIASEIKKPIFEHLPPLYQIMGVQIFKNHSMINGEILNVLVEYVFVKTSLKNADIQSMNVYVSDEPMPDLFLDIMNHHKANGASSKI